MGHLTAGRGRQQTSAFGAKIGPNLIWRIGYDRSCRAGKRPNPPLDRALPQLRDGRQIPAAAAQTNRAEFVFAFQWLLYPGIQRRLPYLQPGALAAGAGGGRYVRVHVHTAGCLPTRYEPDRYLCDAVFVRQPDAADLHAGHRFGPVCVFLHSAGLRPGGDGASVDWPPDGGDRNLLLLHAVLPYLLHGARA